MTEEQGVTGKRRRTAAEIEQIVREFENSGLTGRQFCSREGVSPSMLYRYLRRTVRSESGHGDGLVAVELASKTRDAEPARSCGLAVVLGRGRRIAVSAGFDAATLQRLVHVLETM